MLGFYSRAAIGWALGSQTHARTFHRRAHPGTVAANTQTWAHASLPSGYPVCRRVRESDGCGLTPCPLTRGNLNVTVLNLPTVVGLRRDILLTAVLMGSYILGFCCTHKLTICVSIKRFFIESSWLHYAERLTTSVAIKKEAGQLH
jgi:hypothetical protein